MSPSRPSAAVRLRRLLSIVPWIASQGGTAELAVVADRFGLSVAELESDLMLAACCGVPPYSPDALLEIVIYDGTVTVNPADVLSHPLRLTAADAFAVLAAGQALLAVPGADRSGPLHSALAKIRGEVGEGIAIDVEAPAHLEALREATDQGRVVRLEYYAVSTDEVTTREVEPTLVHLTDGRWYLEAHDRTKDAGRRFRVSRVMGVEPTGERFEPQAVAPPDEVFSPGSDALLVTVRLPPSAEWVAETYPILERRDLADGAFEAVIAVSGRPWLERLLLRVGPDAAVIEPPELGSVAADAARTVLARYR